MYVTELPNGKFKFSESYFDPVKNKYREKSVTLPTNTRKTRNQAQEILDKRIQDYLDTVFSQTTNKALTFREIANKYIEYKKQKNLKVNSLRAMKSRLQILIDTFGDKTIEEINYTEINRFLYELSKHIKSVATRRNSIINIIKFAMLFGYTNIEYPINKIIPISYSTEKLDWKYLEKKEVSLLLSLINNEFHLNIIKCLLSSGMRYNELMALTIEDIDFENKEVTVSKTIIDGIDEVNTPKNGKIRVIHATDEFIMAISNQIRYNDRNNLKHPKGYLFLSKKHKIYRYVSLNYHLSKYNNLFNKNLTSHIFRHTFITRMMEQQVPPNIIAEYVGHEDLKMIEKVYSHFSDELKNQSKNYIEKIKFIST